MKEKQEEKISVIVPLYNEEKHLERCVDSILNQTYHNLEVLLIDDGSTDASPQICEDYAKKDARIKVVHQENQGLSAARNTGIDHASADYYVFIDSDDVILQNMIETLNNIRLKTNADISICSYFQVTEDLEVESDEPREIIELTGEDKFLLLHQSWGLAVVQWNKLFKKEIFEDLRFPVGLYHEDEYIIHHEMGKANKIAYTLQRLYLYYQNPQGITKTPSLEKKYHVCLAHRDRMEYLWPLKYKKAIVKTYFRFKEQYEEFVHDIVKDSSEGPQWEPKAQEMGAYLKEQEKRIGKWNLFVEIKKQLKQKIYNLKIILYRMIKND